MLMEPVQKKKETAPPKPKQPESSISSLPARAEALSGLSMDDVRIHYNSSAPQALGALAYTSGSEIHLGPSQEHCLGHELGHVVQQKQGLVRPQFRLNGLPANEEPALERDADRFSACLQRMRDTGLNGVCGASMPRRGPVQMLRKLVQTGLDKGDVYYDKKDGKYYKDMRETTEPVLDAAYSAAHPPVEAPAEKPPASGGGISLPVAAEEPAPVETVEPPEEKPPASGGRSSPPVSAEEPAPVETVEPPEEIPQPSGSGSSLPVSAEEPAPMETVEPPEEMPQPSGSGSSLPVSAEEPAPVKSVESPAKKQRKRNPRRKRRQGEIPPAPVVESSPPVSEEEPARPVLTNQDVLDFLNEPDEIKARVQLAGNKITCNPAPVPVPFREKTKGGLNRILLQTRQGFFMPDVENPRLLTSGTPLPDDAVYSIRLYAEGEFSHAIGLSKGLAEGGGLHASLLGRHPFQPQDAVVKATEFRSADEVNKAYTPGTQPESAASAITSNKTAGTKNLEYSFGGTTGDMTHPSKEPTPNQVRRQYDRIQSTFFWIPKTDLHSFDERLSAMYTELDGIKQQLADLRANCNGLLERQEEIKAQHRGFKFTLDAQYAIPEKKRNWNMINRIRAKRDRLSSEFAFNSTTIDMLWEQMKALKLRYATDSESYYGWRKESEYSINNKMYRDFMAAKLPKLKDNGILCIVVTNKEPYNEVLDSICGNPPPGYEKGQKNFPVREHTDGTYSRVTYAQILEDSGHNDSGDFQHTQTVELKEVSAPQGDLFYTFRKKSPEGTPHAVPPRKPGDASISPPAAAPRRGRPRNK